MKRKIFITGVTGCVGHYVFDQLVKDPDNELFCMMPNPHKLRRDLAKYPNVRVVHARLGRLQEHAGLLKQMDYVIHLAATWGMTEPNYEWTHELFNLLDPNQVKKVIYFSTASILGADGKLVPELENSSSAYIRGKYHCYRDLSKLAIADKIITLFPTWVLGGDDTHPYSHAMEGIIGAVKWLWLVRFFSYDLSFHFIHARDMALIVDHLIHNDAKENRYILGNALISVEALIKQLCDFYHKRVYFRIRISPQLVKAIGVLFGMSAWDRYCVEKRKFEYNVSNAASFGIASQNATIPDILKQLRDSVL
jgi:nucleoside-diphosphate-sugar epimerase